MQVPAVLLVIVATGVLLAAQTPIPRGPVGDAPKAPTGIRPQEVAVTVSGCLRGKRLEVTPGSISNVHVGLLHATEFVLDGPRDLLQMLSTDHDGHEETLSGIAVVPDSLAAPTVETKTTTRGKVTITGGVRNSGGGTGGRSTTVGDARLPVRLRVQSATHVAERCTTPR